MGGDPDVKMKLSLFAFILYHVSESSLPNKEKPVWGKGSNEKTQE